CEDDEGIFWIGTREGLVRYDPVNELFKTITHNPDDNSSLSHNFVTVIKKDNSGDLWIGTRRGINLLNKKENNFKRFLSDSEVSHSISHNQVIDIEEDWNNNLWIATPGGLNFFNRKTQQFTRYLHNPEDKSSLSNNFVLTIALDEKHIWVGTRFGLNKGTIRPSGITFEKFFLDPSQTYSISSNQISSIVNLDENYLLLGTTSGFNRFNKKSVSFEVFRNDEFDDNSLSADYLTRQYLDRSGVLWIGTLTHGLNLLNLSGEKFINYTKNTGKTNSLSKSSVNCILEENDGTIWLGTEDNINIILNPGKNNETIKTLKDEKWIKGFNIYSIIKDSFNDIWIGTFGGGVIKIQTDGKTKNYLYEEKPGDISNNFIHTIYEDSKNNIWIGTGLGGVNKYDRKNDSFNVYKNKADDSNSVATNEVIAIIEDREGYIWFGTTTKGLSRFNPIENKFKHYSHNTDDLKSLSSNSIVCLYEDQKGRLWIGTFSGGLNLFDKNNETYTYYTQADGLPGNNISAITEDAEGNLWISTDKGLSKFNPEKKTFKNYHVNDGLQGNDFNQNSVFKSKISNRLFFGGSEGLNIFEPEKIKDDSTIPGIVITDFKVFNKSVQPGENSLLKQNILFTDEITISHSDNIFSFEFAALHFSNPEKNQYAYMLEGFDKEWIYSGNRNFATYTNLDPGDYIFHVKGSNADGVWNEEGTSIKLIVNPPVYKTWWAYLIYAALIVFVFLAIRKYDIHREKLKNELKLKDFEAKKYQEVDQLKSRFFANISHEFRTPLTIIIGLIDKLKMKAVGNMNVKDYDVMKRNASRLLHLINQLLELSKIEAGSAEIKVSKNDIIKFLRRIIASFSSFAHQKKLGLYFNGLPSNSERNSEEVFLYFDKEKIETVFYNLLSNAIKFTPEGERIDIDVIKNENEVEIKFTNTGVEIPSEKLPKIFNRFFQVDDSKTKSFEGSGIGLALVKELIELHKGTITAESRNLKTNFIIKLLVGKSVFKEEQVADEPIPEKNDFKRVLPLIAGSENLSAVSKSADNIHSDSTIILLVEDNPDLREFIKEHLEDNYSIVEAENGSTGLLLAEEIIPDLIISDIMMPVMDGYELCHSIKTNEKTSHIPFILLTARAEIKDRLEGLETGADDYLVKPFNPDELLVRVRNLIKTREQLREKFRSEMLLKPADVIVPSQQKVFLEKLMSIIENNVANGKFSIETLCDEAGMSRAQLHRKIKAITNQTTTEFIRNFRLQKAADYIRQDAGNMAEIAYRVGFNSQAYFNKSFQELFGCTPSEYKDQFKSKDLDIQL
ncbi:MAG: hybrid sensor histidine kinase/response regulator, partial [Ignavibacteriales bacterium]